MGFGIPIVSAVSGLLQGAGARQGQIAQNRNLRQAAGKLNSQNVFTGAQQLAPWLSGAMTGNVGSQYGNYGQQLMNWIQNPGGNTQQLLNPLLTQSAQKGQNDLVAAQGRLGRSGMQGGMGDAYALANRAAQTQRDVGLQQQHSLWQQQQLRQDLMNIQNMWNQLIQMQSGLSGQQANLYGQQQAPMNWMSMMGNALGSGLSMYGGMGGRQQAPTPYQATGSWNNANAPVSYPLSLMWT